MAKIRHAGSAYVALSRCKSLDGLQILNFTKSAIVTDKHATQEMARLRDYTLPEYTLLPPRTSNNIRIVHLNVCGLQSHRLDLLSDQLLLEADILCFSETHLQSSDVLPSLSNFVSYRYDRRHSRFSHAGGVAVYCRPAVNASLLDIHNGLECLCLSINDNIALVSVYRPPVDGLLSHSFDRRCISCQILKHCTSHEM